MNHPKITAFMQNPWFSPGTRPEIIDRYKTDQEFHRRLLAQTMSGGRLLNAFGPEMFNRIHWDNVAPNAAVEAAGETDLDMNHVESVIEKTAPNLIITFGKLAEEAMEKSILAVTIDYMVCHHPNARGKTAGDLGQFAVEVEAWCNDWRVKEPLLSGDWNAFRASIEPEIQRKRKAEQLNSLERDGNYD